MNDRQRLEAIVSVVCKYLPPDGIDIKQAMKEIIGLVDPLPAPAQQEPVQRYSPDGEGGMEIDSLGAWVKFTSPQPAQQDMVDDEGENQAVRMFLALYGGQYGITAEQMRKHLKMAGFDGAWPEWANSHNGHLTKAGAQLWIRHLFALEQPAQQEPIWFWTHPTYGRLYKQPPAQRTWVGLTHDEDDECSRKADAEIDCKHIQQWSLLYRRAIEAKLKEKNT